MSTPISVLIIDDDENITRPFSRILQRNGFETDVAYTGAEAIEKCKAKPYSVALIDIILPDLNGMDLIDRLPNHGSRMVKIVITGFPSMREQKQGVAADAYLPKPVRPQELIELIREKTQSR